MAFKVYTQQMQDFGFYLPIISKLSPISVRNRGAYIPLSSEIFSQDPSLTD